MSFLLFFLNPRFGEILTKKICEKISQIYTREIPKKPNFCIEKWQNFIKKKMHCTH